MFAKKTVFVVGAGASAEYGLPVGDKLKANIIDAMPKPREGYEATALHNAMHLSQPNRVTQMMAAAQRIRQGLPLATSIDRFMDYHQGDTDLVELGKLAITTSIIRAEAASTLVTKNAAPIQFSKLDLNWLTQLFLQMQEGTRRTNPADIIKNVGFVCFNYDRVIEHFLFHAVQQFSDCSENEAKEVMKGLEIIHPYGRIGRLPWDQLDRQEPELPFGDQGTHPTRVVDISKGIKTFSEQVEDQDPAMLKAKAMVREAQKIVFLGFSYLDQNMIYLTPNSGLDVNTYLFGTVFGESATNQSLAKSAMVQLAQGISSSGFRTFTPSMHVTKAGEFMRDEGNSLRR
uniref:SIR2-like domain-containing protein n=1 Tax=Caulobacter sp. (strain K31) TaxID=366602 RepID=B0T2Y0_CAUSK